jgi:hypothetical protein
MAFLKSLAEHTAAGEGMELSKFVRKVERWARQPVVDETGLSGGYGGRCLRFWGGGSIT